MKCVILTVLMVGVSSAQSSGVCYNIEATATVRGTSLYRTAYQYYVTYESCGLFLTCSRSKVRSYVQFYISYSTVTTYSIVSQCCAGYVGVPPDCQAACTSGCQNGGTCSLPEVCTCIPGWTGSNCETDIDECNETNQCDHDCTNVNGSFVCSCDSGYELQSDNSTCEDIDECNEDYECNQNCTNVNGSFICSCDPGYELQSNNSTCEDVNECLLDNGGCAQTCNNMYGSYQCSCWNGYELANDNHACIEIDSNTSSSMDAKSSLLMLEASSLPEANSEKNEHLNATIPIVTTLVVVLVLVILLVIVVCIIVRYWRKRNNQSNGVLHKDNAVPCNAVTTATAKKEKELIEEDYVNPTFKKLEESNNGIYSVPNDYEMLNENTYETVL